MRFLVDENLSPQLCQFLAECGDTAEHVHQAVGPGARDQDVIAYATAHGAVIVTADTDFGSLLAQGRKSEPSVVLIRELLSLPVREVLMKGAIVVFSLTDIRVRPLPVT